LGFSLGRVLVDGPIAQQRAIRRDVLIDNGNEDGAMTIDLLRAERLPIGTAVSEPETASNNNDSEASADATNA
jgi:hypothetical protein